MVVTGSVVVGSIVVASGLDKRVCVEVVVKNSELVVVGPVVVETVLALLINAFPYTKNDHPYSMRDGVSVTMLVSSVELPILSVPVAPGNSTLV